MSLQACIAKENEGILLWYAGKLPSLWKFFFNRPLQRLPLSVLRAQRLSLFSFFFLLAYHEVLLTVYVAA